MCFISFPVDSIMFSFSCFSFFFNSSRFMMNFKAASVSFEFAFPRRGPGERIEKVAGSLGGLEFCFLGIC